MEEPNFKVTWSFFENNNDINEWYGNDAKDNDDDDYDDRLEIEEANLKVT